MRDRHDATAGCQVPTAISAINIMSPNWQAVSPGPVIVNGLNTVTNPFLGAQQFFRLSQ